MVRTQEPTGRNQLGFSHCGVPSIRRSDRDVACFGKTILKNIEQAKLWKLSDTVQIAKCRNLLSTRELPAKLRGTKNRRVRKTSVRWTSSDRKSTRLNSSHGYISY